LADLYANFAELKSAVSYDTDYEIRTGVTNSRVLFCSPHAGGIETGCSELITQSARGEHSYYMFEGTRGSNNSELHITSTNFDEPTLMGMLENYDIIVSYHGYSDSINNTMIGGLDSELRDRIEAELTKAGFNCQQLQAGGSISGSEPDNLVNKGRRGMGVQLELSTTERASFFGTNTAKGRRTTQNQRLLDYTNAIRRAINYS
jgi:phage replication-related protein YjqB (UPF0714/DUF867 family)